MPVYSFACEKGHVTDRFYHMKAKRPKAIKCESCPRMAPRLFAPPAVVDDFPEHFNVSMGTVVKNRAHHKALQKQLNCQDYEPPKHSPGSDLVKDRLRSRGRVHF